MSAAMECRKGFRRAGRGAGGVGEERGTSTGRRKK